MTTPTLDLDALERLCDGSSEASIVERRDTHSIYIGKQCLCRVQHGIGSKARALRICESIRALPALIARVRRLEAQIEDERAHWAGDNARLIELGDVLFKRGLLRGSGIVESAISYLSTADGEPRVVRRNNG